jgi:beta-phosphoglucomutase-like phosphatase (HAD superfamily)
VKRNSRSAGLSVTGNGTSVVAHADSVGLRLLADRTGPTGELSTAVASRGSFTPRHDRGRELIDVAAMRAEGGEAIAYLDVLRHQTQVLGPVASAPTVGRTLDGCTEARLAGPARRRARGDPRLGGAGQAHPHLFLAAVRRLGVDPAHSFVVGDSVWDLLAAPQPFSGGREIRQ